MPTRIRSRSATNASIGWIGTGRMGYEMAAHLAKGGADVLAWNRTRAKAEPLAKHGAKVAGHLSEIAERDIVFCMVSTWDDLKEVMTGLLHGAKRVPQIVVECSSISLEEPIELKTGMVFAVETYCPASDGVSAARIEEEVILTPSGPKVISLYPAQELPIANPY